MGLCNSLKHLKVAEDWKEADAFANTLKGGI